MSPKSEARERRDVRDNGVVGQSHLHGMAD